MEENVVDNTCIIDASIVNTNVQNELIEKSQLEHDHVAPSLKINSVEKHQLQNINDNILNNAQAIVTLNSQHEESQFQRSLLEYERIISVKGISSETIIESQTKLLQKLVKRHAYVLHWLDGLSETDTKNIEPSISEQLKEIHVENNNNNQLIDTNCSKEIQLQDTLHKPSNNKFSKRNKWEKNAGCYNEKEDMYVIQHGTFMLFYKNGILSRRRPSTLPVKIRTRPRCLINSHYSIHTELPQGLQDCL